MNVYLLYGYSVVGSVLAECVAAHHYLRRHQRLPARYRKGSFYVVRAAIALGAGVLPVVFAVQTAFAAFALGVGAPLIINQLSRSNTER